ncbi:hypothetical protein PHJA_001684800 [Phtheirospermum japonicum]|uniref:Uncharacterized protein n=1 Tax=Phtheirospermum japonicum TaxID=374723 RepID=A0A830CJZ5_9LAMI|nr:hypothetical protein PHJA_001684800 [Phtheirospermum japonicum]
MRKKLPTYLVSDSTGQLGSWDAQSPMPLALGVRLTSHLAVNVRACCELEEWKRWVISAKLPNNQRQDPDNALYVNMFGLAQHVLNYAVLGQ